MKTNESFAERALAAQERARRVLDESGVAEVWRDAGCRVSLVGSLRMGLLASHRDIDLHVYSSGITESGSFAIASAMAANPNVTEIKCISGLHTDEHCVAWHVMYRACDGELWQIDIIHIEEGTEYDGYFENMADRILDVMTPEQRDTILRLKFETPADAGYHGVEYYEAVIADGMTTMDELAEWVVAHRMKPSYYWVP
ncbi:MAG: phosphoglycerate mutase family protein [Muribaculaceae bacterium]|nr:phosphoglycerate mutase family protein [Muribaculaceae bacterium]